jgi:galactose mutarotase-like enzyme
VAAPHLVSAFASFGQVELRSGGARVRIVPALGGRLTSLELGGREWLWRNETLAPREPPPGLAEEDVVSYAETADSGGYDECFPTVAGCRLPSWAGAYGNRSLPDHGELWTQRPEVAVETDPAGPRATCVWRGRRMPYRFERAVQVTAEGEVRMRYAVTNEGSDRMPWIWSSNPLLPLGSNTRLVLPDGARVRVWSAHGVELDSGADQRWPRCRVGGRLVNMARPAEVARKFACKLFLDLPTSTPGRMALAVEERDARLEVELDPREVPNVGVWINHNGWTPFARGKAYCNLGFEPCVGAPDTLSDALGSWQSAHWLEGRETRRWELVWRAAGGAAR